MRSGPQEQSKRKQSNDWGDQLGWPPRLSSGQRGHRHRNKFTILAYTWRLRTMDEGLHEAEGLFLHGARGQR